MIRWEDKRDWNSRKGNRNGSLRNEEMNRSEVRRLCI